MISSPLSRFHHASACPFPLPDDFSIAWQSPSNIAIIKYWGKKKGQFPMNPSLSMTLNRAITKTRVDVSLNNPSKGLLTVNGDPQHPFLPKMQYLLQQLTVEIPPLGGLTFSADTLNLFPHSTGIASSASGLSAFALCLIGIAGRLMKLEFTMPELKQMASCVSRLGSGSACRSLYGGFTVWGENSHCPGSSNEFAIPVTEFIHPEMLLLRDAILVVSSKPKQLSSSLGHTTMNEHPFRSGRIKQANQNFKDALHALATNDIEQLGSVAECEALTLHALLMSARPGSLLMQPATVEIIHRVREARKGGLPLFFSLDAGANVHLVYPLTSALQVEKFISDTLQPFCEDGRVIFDSCGAGPVELNDLLINE